MCAYDIDTQRTKTLLTKKDISSPVATKDGNFVFFFSKDKDEDYLAIYDVKKKKRQINSIAFATRKVRVS